MVLYSMKPLPDSMTYEQYLAYSNFFGNIFSSEWKGKILFAETSEETPEPQRLRQILGALKSEGVFENISGILVGKPLNEQYYEEYKDIWREGVGNPSLPILYNINFGHAAPRAILPYGALARVNAEKQEILLLWDRSWQNKRDKV